MFSRDSFKYLKSLTSDHSDTLPQPALFEDEFIMYVETLVKGLNYNTLQKYYLEHALPDREKDNAMTALILREGYGDGDPYFLVRTTDEGRFLVEVHASFEQTDYVSSREGSTLPQLVKSLFDQPGFRRYFTIHTDLALGEQHHYIRYEMPLRQMRSRNLLEYTIFILEQAQPFVEAAMEFSKESKQSVAA